MVIAVFVGGQMDGLRWESVDRWYVEAVHRVEIEHGLEYGLACYAAKEWPPRGPELDYHYDPDATFHPALGPIPSWTPKTAEKDS